MFFFPCFVVRKIAAFITRFSIQATLHKSAYSAYNNKKKISKDSRILGYFIYGFFKCSTTLCKILIKNSYHPVLKRYLYQKKQAEQIQNTCTTDSGTLRAGVQSIAKTLTPS